MRALTTTTDDGRGAKVYQNDLGFVELLLHLHDRICLSRILILLQIHRRFREVNRGWVSERRLRDLGREIIEQFSQERKGRSDRVFVVTDKHRCIGRAALAPQTRSTTIWRIKADQPVAQHLPYCTHGQYKRSLAHSGAGLEGFVRQLFWRKMQRILQPILSDRRETRTNLKQWKGLYRPWQEARE